MLHNILTRKIQPYTIFANNTDVGKTIFSCLLAKGATKIKDKVIYFKPVQTGYPEDSDARHVKQYINSKKLTTIDMLNYPDPVSPHLATLNPPTDSQVLAQIQQTLSSGIKNVKEQYRNKDLDLALFLETAGGALSPTLSGNLQADLLRPLRFPVILIGDSRLGGISTTLAAYESLKLRGYDIAHILLFHDTHYRNHEFFQTYFDKSLLEKIQVTTIPNPPNKSNDVMEDKSNMENYYKNNLDVFIDVNKDLEGYTKNRFDRLDEMSGKAKEKIWWPFTQHQLVNQVGVIDSAYQDQFQFYESNSLKDKFDGCASWWTQGLGHGNPQLSLAAAYAAGRYGHAMFPENVHEPGLALAENLLETVGKGWADRAYFSDNGSTGIEIALKMALAASQAEKEVKEDRPFNEDRLDVVGLKGAYHGDTIGAMDAADPNVYNQRIHWYKPRGHWFDPPTILLKDGEWTITLPDDLAKTQTKEVFPSFDSIFEYNDRTTSDLANLYRQHIMDILKTLSKEGRKFGALLMEPLVLGAGGMHLVDPLFQKILIQMVRQELNIPVIFDEVFTGFYRLGSISAASILKENPDISVYSKALTGGVAPLCVTLATESIYKVFEGPSKLSCLLHGHSYTAYPIGCQLALTSLKTYDHSELIQNLNHSIPSSNVLQAWTRWDSSFIEQVSKNPKVQGIFGLGGLLAIHLNSGSAGYGSNEAKTIIDQLRYPDDEDEMANFVRPLGNVVYIIASHITEQDKIEQIQQSLLKALK